MVSRLLFRHRGLRQNMAWIFVVLALSLQSMCIYSTNNEMERIQEESEFFEVIQVIGGYSGAQWRVGNETNSNDSIIDPVVVAAAALIGAPIALAALAPPPLPRFPPQGVPQPGATATGGGALPTTALINSAVGAEVTFLASGIPGATVLAVFSSSLPGTFLIPRTVPATAILFKEPDLLSTSRKYSHSSSHHRSCPKTFLPPVLNKLSKVTQPISTIKSSLYRKLGISCFFPRLLRPFQPIIERIGCKLGFDADEDNGFMEAPACDLDSCREPSIEDKIVTRSLGLPNMDYMIQGQISTMDDCFGDMIKVTYGSRVLAKIVDDQPCEDPRYQNICQEMTVQNRVLFEEDCQSSGCADPIDDPFTACFGCDNVSSKTYQTNFDHDEQYYPQGYQDYGDSIDRQAGESFKATQQSMRLVCRRSGAGGRQSCRLRIDRMMEVRNETYGTANLFFQDERYLSEEDLNIFRKYL